MQQACIGAGARRGVERSLLCQASALDQSCSGEGDPLLGLQKFPQNDDRCDDGRERAPCELQPVARLVKPSSIQRSQSVMGVPCWS